MRTNNTGSPASCLLLVAAAFTLLATLCPAQEAISSTGIAVTQNFDALGSGTNAALPAGWRMGTNWATGSTNTTRSAGTTGSSAIGPTSAGGFYNWGNGVNATSSERAVGFLTSGSYSAPRSLIYAFQNNTGLPVSSITLNWSYEKYRSGSNAFTWKFYHGSTALADAALTEGDQAYAGDAAGNSTIFNPPSSTSKSVTITGLNIPSGGVYYLRWSYTQPSALSANSQGLGVDDFSITLTSSTTPSLSSIGALAPFATSAGTASAPQTITAAGVLLSADIVITAPADFEVSSDGTIFGDTATIPQTGGSASGTVWVRLKASASAGSKSGNVVISSTGAASINVPASGTVSEVGAPILNLSSASISNLATSVGVPSLATNYTIAGANLTEIVAVTPSVPILEVSTNGTDYTNSLSLLPASGSLSNTIYLRVAATVAATNFSASVSHVSGSATNLLAVSGAVTNLPPALAASPASLGGFSTLTNAPSSVQTFSVVGSNLTNDVSLSAPLGFEVSADGTNWTTNTVIGRVAGAVSNIVSVRIAATNIAGFPSGTVRASSSGLFANVAVSGTISVADTYVSLTNGSTTYSNNFDSLGMVTISNVFSGTRGIQTSLGGVAGSAMDGWYAAKIGGGGSNSSSLIGDNGSSSGGGIYSYGTGGNSERALGSLAGGTAVAGFGALIRNNTGRNLLGVQIGFTAEFWRSSTSEANTLTFGYGALNGTSVSASNFLTASNASAYASANIVGPAPVTASGALDGNNPANQASFTALTIPMPLAPGQIMFIRWQDADNAGSDAGLAVDNISITALEASSNADLAGLALSAGILSPAFDPSTISYAADVNGATSALTVTPTAADGGATLEARVNGGAYSPVQSGAASASLPLVAGENSVEIKVTAADGTTTKIYSVAVMRAPGNGNADLAGLSLGSGSLYPSFSAATTSYSASLGGGLNSITVNPIVADSGATLAVRINGGPYSSLASGSPSAALPLVLGNNILEVLVTSSDGTVSKTYAVYIKAFANYVYAADYAENYADFATGWSSAGNRGFGFGNWVVQTAENAAAGSYAGVFIADPANIGITGFDGTAFGLYANIGTPEGPEASVTATRPLVAPLAIGTKLRFKWGINWNSGNGVEGNKGFYLSVGGTEVVRVNNAGTDIITINGVDTGFGYGTSAMTWTFERLSATQLKITANDRDGVGLYSGILDLPDSAVDNVCFYASNMLFGFAREPYFDDLQVLDADAENPSSIADLSNISIDSGALSPAFNPATTSYSVSVGNRSVSLVFAPTTADTKATVAFSLNGGAYQTISSGSWSDSFTLNIGSNTLEVRVTAEDGLTTKIYTVNVSRAALGGNLRQFENNSGMTIPDVGSAQPYPSTISVSGLGFATKLTVYVDGFSHSWPDDVDILLVSPDGKICSLLSDAGYGYPVAGLKMTFDDVAPSAAPDNTFLGSGLVSFRPTNFDMNIPGFYPNTTEALPPGGSGSIGLSLQALLSGTLNGDWKLFVLDDEGPDGGLISSWSLVFETSASGQPVAPTLDSPSFSNVTTGGATLAGTVYNDGGSAITERGIIYSLTSANNDPVIDGAGVTKISVPGGLGLFATSVSGLAQGTNYTFKAYAINAAGTSYSSVLSFTTTTPSSNAELSALSLSGGGLLPAFDPAITGYAADVTKETSSVALTAVAAQADATLRIRVNGGQYNLVGSGSPSAPLALAIGPNTVEVLVTAQDGVSTKNYSVIVTRSSVSSNALLSSLSASAGSLSPSFVSGTRDYAVSVVNAVSAITVTPIAAEANAAIQIRSNQGAYSPISSGSSSAPLALNVGSNSIEIEVTAQDGVTTATYALTVTRAPQMLGSIPDQSITIGSSAPVIPLSLSGIQTNVTIRTLAANLTSGGGQKYEGPGTRILQGLKPDVVMIQEFNVSNNTTQDLRSWVDSSFGSDFQYYRENPSSSKAIPNGVISRWPIVAAGFWDDGDDGISDRNFAWAIVDIPGPRDLWVVSVHLKSESSPSAERRNLQAQKLVELVTANVPPEAYLLIGGDFNTQNDWEQCLNTLGSVVDVTDKPTDEAGDADTNQPRNKPYDRVMAEPELDALEVPFAVGNISFSNGLVFDSRVFSDLSLVQPVQLADSAAFQMQHMAVGRSFRLSASDIATFQVESSNHALLPAGNVQVLGTGTNRSLSITPVHGQTGTSTITITVSDGVSSDTRSFNFSVTGSSFASWSSNAPLTETLLSKYATGGATNISAASEAHQFSKTNGRFWISAIVRTNDPLLSIVGEASGSLSSWSTNGVTESPAADASGVPDGCQRRIYSVELTNNPSRQFLRLKATLSP